MTQILVLIIFTMCLFVPDVHAGAAVAMQKRKGAGGAKPQMPQQLPPGYVMTPQGVKKLPDAVVVDEPAEPVPVEDIVDLEQLMTSLETSSEAWKLVISQDDKAIIVDQFIQKYAEQGVTIRKPSSYYAMMIDQMSEGSPDMLAMPFERVLQVVAVMEYDFGNGQNPDLLAQKMLGGAYERNKQRLMQAQGQMAR